MVDSRSWIVRWCEAIVGKDVWRPGRERGGIWSWLRHELVSLILRDIGLGFLSWVVVFCGNGLNVVDNNRFQESIGPLYIIGGGSYSKLLTSCIFLSIGGVTNYFIDYGKIFIRRLVWGGKKGPIGAKPPCKRWLVVWNTTQGGTSFKDKNLIFLQKNCGCEHNGSL